MFIFILLVLVILILLLIFIYPKSNNTDPPRTEQLPTNFDAHDKWLDRITASMDSGDCSACPSIERPCNNGCMGGSVSIALDYLIKYGVNSTTANPIPSPISNLKCNVDPNKNIFKIKGYNRVVLPNDDKETKRNKIMQE